MESDASVDTGELLSVTSTECHCASAGVVFSVKYPLMLVLLVLRLTHLS